MAKKDAAAAWERRTDESARAYEAFSAYRDLGPSRTFIAAYRKVTGKADASSGDADYYGKWAKKYDWQERAAKYDDYLDSMKRSQTEAVIVESALKEAVDGDSVQVWKARSRILRNQQWEIGQAFLKQAKEMIEYPIVQQKVITPDGQTIVIQPIRWYDKQVAASLAKVGAELTRQAVGDVVVPDDEPASVAQRPLLPGWLQRLITAPEPKDEQIIDVKVKVNGSGSKVTLTN